MCEVNLGSPSSNVTDNALNLILRLLLTLSSLLLPLGAYLLLVKLVSQERALG